jgi:hypothetical protein
MHMKENRSRSVEPETIKIRWSLGNEAAMPPTWWPISRCGLPGRSRSVLGTPHIDRCETLLVPCSAARVGTRVRGVTTDESQSSLVGGAPVRRRSRLSFLAVTGLLIVAVLVAGDWWQAKREMGHLLDAVTISETAMTTGSDTVGNSVIKYFGGGANQYLSQSERDTANREIATQCATAAADVQDTGAQVGEVFVVPWHRSIGEALNAYLAHSKAWQNRFAACADDAPRYWDGSTSAQIDGTWRIAHRAFTKALPFADGSDRGRVETLFKG